MMESLAGLKTISIVFLVVALAGASPVFADGTVTTLTPAAACPNAEGILVHVSGITVGSVSGGLTVEAIPILFISSDGPPINFLSSVPDGLVVGGSCGNIQPDGTLDCQFDVSESASCGHYTVKVMVHIPDQTDIEIGSAPFDVAGTCCPAVGGCLQPVNTFALLSPWLAVIGLVGCIGTVVVVAKKQRP